MSPAEPPAADPAVDPAEPPAGTGAVEEVRAVVADLYDAFLAGDRPRFDAHLDPAVTTWESHLPGLLDRAALDAHRDARDPAAGTGVAALRVEERRVDDLGGCAVARYVLRVELEAGGSEVARVTDVLVRRGGRWRIVHHHAEALPGGGGVSP